MSGKNLCRMHLPAPGRKGALLFMCRHVNKAFFVTVRALIFVNQITLLMPIIYRQRKGIFLTNRLLTIWAIATCLAAAIASPVLIANAAAMYAISNVRLDPLYMLVAVGLLWSEVAISLLILASQIWKRKQLINVLNSMWHIVQCCQRFERHFIGGKFLLLLWLQLLLIFYELLVSVPFLIKHAGKIPAIDMLAQLLLLHLQQLRLIFEANVFSAILLVTACYQQLEVTLKSVATSDLPLYTRLLQVEQALSNVLQMFTQTFQFGIFLVLIINFVGFLANLYALLHIYVVMHQVNIVLLVYCIRIALNLCALMFVAQLCNVQQQRVQDLLLRPSCLKACEAELDPLWPCTVELSILGMFTLGNAFWLVLFSYTVDFVVFIVQFALFSKALEQTSERIQQS